jgi:hypothetical protein
MKSHSRLNPAHLLAAILALAASASSALAQNEKLAAPAPGDTPNAPPGLVIPPARQFPNAPRVDVREFSPFYKRGIFLPDLKAGEAKVDIQIVELDATPLAIALTNATCD